jgi:hypothetical protein
VHGLPGVVPFKTIDDIAVKRESPPCADYVDLVGDDAGETPATS